MVLPLVPIGGALPPAEPPQMARAENMLHLPDCARQRATPTDDLARGEFGATLSNGALRRVRRLGEACGYCAGTVRAAFNSP
jgi:hypothetical protein